MEREKKARVNAARAANINNAQSSKNLHCSCFIGQTPLLKNQLPLTGSSILGGLFFRGGGEVSRRGQWPAEKGNQGANLFKLVGVPGEDWLSKL